MAYADYDFYKNVYFGNKIDEPSFNQLAERAAEYMSYITYGKSDNALDDMTLTMVKKCNCAVAELLSEYGSNDYDIVTKSSESVGSWSVSYATGGSGNSRTLLSLIVSKMSVYLMNTGLMYMGVC